MTIYELKPKFQALLRPITRLLARSGVTANQVTVFACLLSFGTGILIWFRIGEPAYFIAVPVVLFVRMALNAIDGMLAREHQMKSRLGGILNELTDVLSDSALYLPFAYLPGVAPELVVAVVLLAMLSEMTGVVAVAINASRRYDGPMGKSDRAFVFGLVSLLIGFGITPGAWLNLVLGVVLVLLVLTVVNRSRRALAEGV